MKIVFSRIDDRLIHGQIVTRWLKEIIIDRLIIVNDDLYNDEFRKTIILKTSPANLKLNIVNIEIMIKAYFNKKYLNDKVMLIFVNPKDVLDLLNNKIEIKSLNIGGISYKDGKIKLTNFIYVYENELDYFKKINKLGVYLDARMVSTDKRLNLIEVINNLKL